MTESPGHAAPIAVETRLVAAHGLAALIMLLIAVVFGIVASLQLILPDLIGGWLPAGWGRLRYAHTQGIMLGWLGNAFFAFLYHAVPILTGRPVTSRRLGLALFGIWNFAFVVPGWILVLAGVSQPLEWAEFPLSVDAFAMLGLGIAAVQFLPPFFRRGLESLYVSGWYILGSLIFTLLAFPMGNVVPEVVPGAAGAAFSGLWIHDAVGLFVTPLALAILYYVIPATTGRPIYSHFLSMLGFWGLFFLYPLNGTHHYVYSVIPMAAQQSAIAASALLGVIVIIVVTNLLLSLRGTGLLPRDAGLRFVAMSTVFYLIVSVQGSIQAQMQINEVVHFSDWVIGHSHLAMLGFATFAALGGLVHAWQRIPWARYNARAIRWAWWLLVFGVSVMVIDLTAAGLVEAEAWIGGAPWLESVRAAQPYWIVRSLSAIPIAAGFIAIVVGLTTGPRGGMSAAHEGGTSTAPAIVSPGESADEFRPARTLTMTYCVAGIAGIAFFVMSVALLGAWPRRVLSEQTAAMSPPGALGLSPAEERGRRIYAREGCAYCHTQQIRYTEADMARFGAPTLAWETRFDYPHLWGTRRIGPDLSREHGVRTANWHYVHLYAPRAIAPLSVMPAYPSLFDGGPDRPTLDARDLVAYLESLGRARALAWPEGDAAARAAAPAGDHWAQMAFAAPELNAHPARARPRGAVPALPVSADPVRGRVLWREHCAGCHGGDGRGDGAASRWLVPRPPDLTAREFAATHVADALFNGTAGTSMPAWRDLPADDLAALVGVVRDFAAVPTPPVASSAQLADGERVYRQHCAECHGADGAGDGFAASELPIAPTSFLGRRASADAVQQVLESGVAGTSMAPWTDRLDAAERDAVAAYLATLFRSDP